jgi:Ca2+-binding EF-hand superfamily protein
MGGLAEVVDALAKNHDGNVPKTELRDWLDAQDDGSRVLG